MIGRKSDTQDVYSDVKPKGFDDYEVRLGDVMRGERATLGKSLLDVQRELRIKASYIAAIENCDPDAFDTPGFIAGYVRSYARYLNMDPDEAFEVFCEESGFSVAHGMSAQASVVKKQAREEGLRGKDREARDMFTAPSTPFVPSGEAFWSRIEPGAIGSSLVLMGLIAAIGFGGWTVLQQVQRVQVAPVEQTPTVLADLDPLESVVTRSADPTEANVVAGPAATERAEALDRLYRPQALDVPVLVARDAPISTLDPRAIGNFASGPEDDTPVVAGLGTLGPNETPSLTPDSAIPNASIPQVVEDVAPQLQLVAVRESWVRVRAADGTVIFEAVMQPGDTWLAPLTEEAPTLRTGNAGGIYFAMDDAFYGPVGEPGAVSSGLELSIAGLQEVYDPVAVESDDGLVRYAEALAAAAGSE